ncbi:hypothetical protein LJR164_004470 [Phenylobacterium sp. LjRoot164]|uniref:transcriptional regulator n=1 Tax=unclassified Phenylobacterium TaxID=2640670 RepID=UPI003ED0620D
MTSDRDLAYQAQYQRNRRAKLRAAGLSPLHAAVPEHLLVKLDEMKRARGLSNRDAALTALLSEFFGPGGHERKPAVSA